MTTTLDAKRSTNFLREKQNQNYRSVFVDTRVEPDPTVHVERTAGLPTKLIEIYVSAALRHAVVDQIDPDGWFAEIKGFEGVYGEAGTADAALDDLRESLPLWVAMKIDAGAGVPDLDGLSLSPRRAA